ncbi:MAG: SUMF1/EgtB/PvdO family nonheme iron enzyme, partial [Saprospiraceae bacterium]|nr:SUMF1/EgtB/PvdO family nonheme iron enzyme [Saprospiraceae bacterium]
EPVYHIEQDTVIADFSANGIRLPTEAEWEYAARSGGDRIRLGNDSLIADPSEINYNGDILLSDRNSKSGLNRKKTTAIGSFSPNRLGLFDMSGNVWEWCWDIYAAYSSSPEQNNPTGPISGAMRVIRGGSWADGPNSIRSTTRGFANPKFKGNYIGFRIARNQ